MLNTNMVRQGYEKRYPRAFFNAIRVHEPFQKHICFTSIPDTLSLETRLSLEREGHKGLMSRTCM